MIVLPRQARDKCRDNFKKDVFPRRLDWPQGYVGKNTSSTYGMPGCNGNRPGTGMHNTWDPTIIAAIKSFVKPLGDIAVMGEAYNDHNTNWPFLGAARFST